MTAAKNMIRSGNPAIRAAAERRIAEGAPPRITWVSWVRGARMRTLPLAIAPVAAGAGIAGLADAFSLTLSLLALAVAGFLQIGVNFANDYSDGIRGTDDFRVGPARLTASGLVNPKKVLATALTFFALAAAAGLVAVVLSGRWWFIAVGALAILAAWFYTGGKRPYGYAGLGELAVFVFFGVVATVGTVWLQTENIPQEAWITSVGVGLFAVAVLVANNTRDIATDKLAGKRTLSVRIGDRASRVLFTVLVLAPLVIPAIYLVVYPKMLFVLFVAFGSVSASVIMLWARSAKEMIISLVVSSLSALAYGVLMGIAFAL